MITGGTVLNGTASKPLRADVGIRNGIIEMIGDLSAATASETLSASDAVVAPGFIDAHGHSDYTLLVDGRAISQISQGVTTEVIGNCGHGCEPLTDDLQRFTGNIYGYEGSVELSWRTTAEYLEQLECSLPAINVVPLTPAGNLRRVTMAGLEDWASPASEGEHEEMLKLVRAAMSAGSNGISFGLEYRQEASATRGELVALSRLTAELGGIVAIHTRDKDQLAVEAVEEAILIARESSAPVQVSHILPRRTAPEGSLEAIVSALGSARDEGLNIAFDVHTRTHGITNLSDCISPGVLKNGPSASRAALADCRWSDEVQDGNSIIHRFATSGWDNVQVFSSKYTPDVIGVSVAEIAKKERCEPWEAVRRLLDATNGDVHNVMVVCDSYDEIDIVNTARLPGCLVGSDATTLCPDGPLADAKFLGAYTWAAWLYSKLTGPPHRLTPAQTVAKLASEPAKRFGLNDRGKIEVGKKADIVVFESERFGTQGTITNPNVLATGMRHVIVNGSTALRDGTFTGNRTGRVLRKTR